MRRFVFMAGAAAVAGAAIMVGRWRGSWSPGVPGAMPGRIGSWVNSYLNRPLYALMAEALDLQPDDDLLDVACGSGVFLAEYAAHVGRVAGIDLSEPKVGLARQRLGDRIAAGTAEVATGDAAALPWEDGRFTAVTSMDAWGFLLLPEVLPEMHRVLRPGGRAVVQIGFGVPEGGETHRFLATIRAWNEAFRAWDEADVRRMIEEAGFSDVTVSYGRTAGDMRLFGLAARLFGFDESRLVRGVKPLPVQPVHDTSAAGAVAVG